MGQCWSQRLGPAVTSPMYWLFHLNDTCEANLVWSYGDVGPPCGADKRGLGFAKWNQALGGWRGLHCPQLQ